MQLQFLEVLYHVMSIGIQHTYAHMYIRTCTHFKGNRKTAHKREYAYTDWFRHCLFKQIPTLGTHLIQLCNNTQCLSVSTSCRLKVCKLYSGKPLLCVHKQSNVHSQWRLSRGAPIITFCTEDAWRRLSSSLISGIGKVLSQWRHWWLYWDSSWPVVYQVSKG